MAYAAFSAVRRFFPARSVLAFLLLTMAFAASAQVCPSRLTIVVGFTPGGSNDVIARTDGECVSLGLLLRANRNRLLRSVSSHASGPALIFTLSRCS